MYAMLEQSELKGNDYRYSDLGYYLFQRMLEKRNNEPLDTWVRTTFYALGSFAIDLQAFGKRI